MLLSVEDAQQLPLIDAEHSHQTQDVLVRLGTVDDDLGFRE